MRERERERDPMPARRRPDYGETLYCLEYAKSNRSTCKGCGQKIDKDELRIGSTVPGEGDYDMTSWKHLGCQMVPLKVSPEETWTEPTQIHGFDELPSSGKDAVTEMMSKAAGGGGGSSAAPPKAAGKKGKAAAAASDEPPAKKGKAAAAKEAPKAAAGKRKKKAEEAEAEEAAEEKPKPAGRKSKAAKKAEAEAEAEAEEERKAKQDPSKGTYLECRLHTRCSAAVARASSSSASASASAAAAAAAASCCASCCASRMAARSASSASLPPRSASAGRTRCSHALLARRTRPGHATPWRARQSTLPLHGASAGPTMARASSPRPPPRPRERMSRAANLQHAARPRP